MYVEILDPGVVFDQFLKIMTCQVEAEFDCHMAIIYRLTLQLINICVIRPLYMFKLSI